MSARSALQLPKEHGSWGMFFIPVALGFVAAEGMSWLFLGAGTFAFLAREPFMAAWRALRRKTEGGHAFRMAVVYSVGAALLGLPLLRTRPSLLAFGVVGAVLYMWHAEAAMRGEGRSLAVEMLAIGISMLGAPAAYYAATGIVDGKALLAWFLCAIYFLGTVFYVRMRLTSARARRPEVVTGARRACMIYHAAQAALVAWLPLAAVGFLPAQVRAWWYAFRPNPNVNLKQVGWTEVVWSLVFTACAGAALRNF